MPAHSHHAILQVHTIPHMIFFASAYLSGYLIQIILERMPDNIVRKIPVINHTAACHQDPHIIIRFYIILRFYIQIHFLRQPVTCARKYYPGEKCHIIHCYTHARFTRHCPLLNMIQKKIPSSWFILLLVETETSQFNQKKSIQTQIRVGKHSLYFFRVRVRDMVQSDTQSQ